MMPSFSASAFAMTWMIRTIVVAGISSISTIIIASVIARRYALKEQIKPRTNELVVAIVVGLSPFILSVICWAVASSGHKGLDGVVMGILWSSILVVLHILPLLVMGLRSKKGSNRMFLIAALIGFWGMLMALMLSFLQ